MSLAHSVLSFALVAGLVTIIPGLDTAIVLRSAISQGRRHGFATALGVNCGVLVWGAAAAVGVSALLAVSTVAYTALRIVGAVYMLWFGVRLLRQALRQPTSDSASDDRPFAATAAASNTPEPASRSFTRGLTTNLLNPKVGAFYVSVLPQFIPHHDSHLLVGLLLAGVHNLESLVWFTALILTAHTARALLARGRTQRVIDGVTGSVLVGFGIRLGLSTR